ncbi:unnamed protein product [Brachionus calyciflorus]|uniref:Cyclic nucleotide-binding domain-containing protein n=1 Tax=Brachionus calyciflorus TaxID=104777 RepID=A0A813MFW1_9BILA|nr:unnamed protein product [Brachionus calyciflorus]
MPSFYQTIINVISKPSANRTDEEITFILAWFLNLFKKKSAVFGDIKPEIVKDIIKNCRFETKNYNDIIIKQGDVGDCFYINLHGKVSIYINHKKHDEEDKLDLSDSLNGDDHENSQGLIDLNVSLNDSYDRNRKFREKLGNYVTALGAGEGFGEIALVSDENRTATIIADEQTDLMVVDKALYARCLQASTLRKLEEKREFINKSAFFGNWAPKMKKLLSLCLERDIIPYDSYLGLQGEPADKIYFIISGQAKLIVNPSKHPAQYPKLYPLKLPEDKDKHIIKTLIDRKNKINQTSEVKSIGIKRRNQTFAQAEMNLKSKNMEIGIITAGEITGLCEVIFDMPTYMHTARCLEDCDVFYIYKRSYERLIAKRNAFCINKMKEYVHMKLNVRNMRLKNSCPIDLYRSIEYMIELSKQKRTNNELDLIYYKNTKKKLLRVRSNKITEHQDQPIEEQDKNEESPEYESIDQDNLQDVALNELESRMREWHHGLGYEKVNVPKLNRIDIINVKSDVKEGVNILIKRSLNNSKADNSKINLNRSRSNSDAFSSSESACTDNESPTNIKFVKNDSNEAKFFNALSVKLLPLNSYMDESIIQSNDSSLLSHNLYNASSFTIQRRRNSASTYQDELNESRILNESVVLSDKYKRKQSMPNIILNRKDSTNTNNLQPYVTKRKYSIGQIKIQHSGKQYSKEEYMALKDELKKQLRKYSHSSIHV